MLCPSPLTAYEQKLSTSTSITHTHTHTHTEEKMVEINLPSVLHASQKPLIPTSMAFPHFHKGRSDHQFRYGKLKAVPSPGKTIVTWLPYSGSSEKSGSQKATNIGPLANNNTVANVNFFCVVSSGVVSSGVSRGFLWFPQGQNLTNPTVCYVPRRNIKHNKIHDLFCELPPLSSTTLSFAHKSGSDYWDDYWRHNLSLTRDNTAR